MKKEVFNALAITMWDFSWIERRWAGAGFEDMDKALDGLVQRGYNAIRIDAFPHLLAKDKDKEWMLLPVWYSNDWGSPYKNSIKLYPAFPDFLRKCKQRKIKVALSSWYREDEDDVRMEITSAKKMADNWIAVLDLVKSEGLLDTILYVDLCNEWPGNIWAPYFENDPKDSPWGSWYTHASMEYMKQSVERIREQYDDIPLCYSFDGIKFDLYKERDLSFFDMIDHHLWMPQLNNYEFYNTVGQSPNGRWSDESYHLLSDNALRTYNERPEYWKGLLKDGIIELGNSLKEQKLMLATTECWGIVDYKDYPMLSWDWVKELCELGVKTSLETGRWMMVATSNFACPQFVGMWRDIDWHKQLTDRIKKHEISPELLNDRLKKAMVYKTEE